VLLLPPSQNKAGPHLSLAHRTNPKPRVEKGDFLSFLFKISFLKETTNCKLSSLLFLDGYKDSVTLHT
jgi:hypothetical protein